MGHIMPMWQPHGFPGAMAPHGQPPPPQHHVHGFSETQNIITSPSASSNSWLESSSADSNQVSRHSCKFLRTCVRKKAFREQEVLQGLTHRSTRQILCNIRSVGVPPGASAAYEKLLEDFQTNTPVWMSSHQPFQLLRGICCLLFVSPGHQLLAAPA